MSKHKKVRNIQKSVAMGALVLSMLAFFVTGAFSKYRNIVSQYCLEEPEKFYLFSNRLTSEGNASSPYNLYNRDLNFDYFFNVEIQNYKNDLNISNLASVVKMSSDNQSITFEPSEIVMGDNLNAVEPQKVTVTVKIPAHLELKDDLFTVRAISSSSYYAEISGTFLISEKESFTGDLKAVHHDEYVELFINMQVGRNYTITWPSWLEPDNFSPMLIGALNPHINSIKVAGSGEYEVLRFFIVGDFNPKNKFTVKESGKYSQTVNWYEEKL